MSELSVMMVLLGQRDELSPPELNICHICLNMKLDEHFLEETWAICHSIDGVLISFQCNLCMCLTGGKQVTVECKHHDCMRCLMYCMA